MTVRTILVGYDGSEHADRALQRALEYRSAFDATVVVLTVKALEIGANPPGLVAPVVVGGSPVEVAQKRAEKVIAQARAAAGDAIFVTRVGEPAASILDVAEEHDADLIMVGTAQPGLVERLFGGSVSQSVARRATTDVLIVH